MKNHILKTAILFIYLFVSTGIQSQSCITYHSDFSGYDWDDDERTRISDAACNLKGLVEDAGITGFQVHTFGFYGYNPNMQGGTEAVWNQFLATKVNTSTPHLAIGKEIGIDGSFKKFWVSFSIPLNTCFNQQTIDIINVKLNENYHISATNPSPVPVIDKCIKLIKLGFCDCPENRNMCDVTLDDILTLKLNFRKTQITIGSPGAWTNGTNGIYDFFGNAVSFNGGTFYIPEQVNDSKAAYQNPVTVTSPDTTIIGPGLQGVVAIYDIESFYNISNEWNNIQNSVGADEFNEAWVVLKDNSGQWWLYSRFTIGAFPNISIDPQTQYPTLKETNNSGTRTIPSPFNLALKTLGNAAIDAVVQAVIIRLTDEKVNDWETAFKKVDYLGAAWTGVSSLWPWKTTKSKFGKAILDGFASVAGKAVTDPSYTVSQGIKDFVVATSASLVTGFIGEIGNAAGKYLEGAFRMMSNTSGGQKVFAKAIAVKCFALGGCFLPGTPVYAVTGIELMKKPIEKTCLFDIVAAHSTVNAHYGLTASINTLSDDMAGHNDPYTSDEQRARDAYTVNDTDWYSVTFDQIDGTSSCQLALHHDRIQTRGYNLHDTIQLSLLEQGISGPFRVTDIRHILPQKVPEDDIKDGYDYRHVTGIFTHLSDKVLMIHFESGDSLGITENHPVFSSTTGGWKHALELEAGEYLLTYLGEAKVSGITKLPGTHLVYNLEVKDLHNFLVGDAGVLVHNGCPNVAKRIVGIPQFQAWVRKFKTKPNHRSHLPDGQFEDYATGSRTQYEIIGGNTKIWADGVDELRNGLIDAKHNQDSYYTIESYFEKPFMYDKLNDEFDRYSKIIADKSTNAAQLIIKLSNNKESSILLFKHLAHKYNVPTIVEVIPWP